MGALPPISRELADAMLKLEPPEPSHAAKDFLDHLHGPWADRGFRVAGVVRADPIRDGCYPMETIRW